MAALVDQHGRAIKPKELVREHSAPTLTGVRTLWDETVASGLTPVRLAQLLRSAAEGDHNAYLTLAEEMEEREMHYAAELSKRKLAVSRLPVTVESYSDSAHDIKLADAVRDLIRRPGFRSLLKDLLDALGKGYSAVEILWQTGAQWRPAAFEWRDPRFFQFDQCSRRQLRLRDEADLMHGVELPPYKYLVHIHKMKSGIPIRGGLAFLACWAFMCKSYCLKDWLAFAEVFGMPLRLGKYGNSAKDSEIAILKSAVANLGADAAAVFPESMQIELIEAGNKGGAADFFERLANYFDSLISKGVLGQTASAAGTPGKLGDEKLQSEVRNDIRDDDAEQLEETLNRDLVKPFIDLNFGAQENYPQIELKATPAEDVTALVTALAALVPLGLQVEQSVVRDKIGLPDPGAKARPEDLLQAQQMMYPQQMGMNHAAAMNAQRPAVRAGDALADNLAARADAPMSAWVERVRNLTGEAADLQELLDMVEQAFPQMDTEEMARVVGQELLRAQMVGRLEVENE